MTLNLTLKKKWFDMILSGEKTEEYREIKPYWEKRLLNKTFDFILFRNGYSKDAPYILRECHGIEVREGNPEWGAEFGEKYFVIKLKP